MFFHKQENLAAVCGRRSEFKGNTKRSLIKVEEILKNGFRQFSYQIVKEAIDYSLPFDSVVPLSLPSAFAPIFFSCWASVSLSSGSFSQKFDCKIQN